MIFYIILAINFNSLCEKFIIESFKNKNNILNPSQRHNKLFARLYSILEKDDQ